ncbi:helix-turn-helix domain-containing protein [Hymenobacter latericus]|uniref:helix-turn-helix domain-containing protein n=1 Tax=Hymenobacter sp. YIM 151858-1 TaxID=2987688 RepID=UPI002226B372|nr:helix-turn-helix domain-containing protein [Hymenobacter sp. YIM 151858-1]UYZ60072.1 helix-turn-helix domain-containing protein [Hymenobacter sp. YIM 151858-1]
MARQQVREELNPQTGRWERKILNQYSQRVKTQLFSMLPHPTSPLLFSITRIKDMHVLLALCEFAEFNTNKVYLTGARRQEVMALAGVTSQHLSNALRRLREKGVLTSGKGEVAIQPSVIWKGTTGRRAEVLGGNQPDEKPTSKAASPSLAHVESTFDSE